MTMVLATEKARSLGIMAVRARDLVAGTGIDPTTEGLQGPDLLLKVAEAIELLYLVPASELARRDRGLLGLSASRLPYDIQYCASKEYRVASEMAECVYDTLAKLAAGEVVSLPELETVDQFLRFVSGGASRYIYSVLHRPS